MFDTFVQIMILTLTGAGVYMTGHKNAKIRRVGFLIGLAGQPFWLITSGMQINKQWGVFLLALWFTYSYWKGYSNLKGQK